MLQTKHEAADRINFYTCGGCTYLVPMAGITKNIGVRDETLFALLMIAVSIVLFVVILRSERSSGE